MGERSSSRLLKKMMSTLRHFALYRLPLQLGSMSLGCSGFAAMMLEMALRMQTLMGERAVNYPKHLDAISPELPRLYLKTFTEGMESVHDPNNCYFPWMCHVIESMFPVVWGLFFFALGLSVLTLLPLLLRVVIFPISSIQIFHQRQEAIASYSAGFMSLAMMVSSFFTSVFFLE